MPTLTVQRDIESLLGSTRFRYYNRSYRIFVDGVEAGQIWEGEALHLPITFGYHVVEAKIDWRCGSRPLRFWPKSEHEVVRSEAECVIGAFLSVFSTCSSTRAVGCRWSWCGDNRLTSPCHRPTSLAAELMVGCF
jgi:hypothetical protein